MIEIELIMKVGYCVWNSNTLPGVLLIQKIDQLVEKHFKK